MTNSTDLGDLVERLKALLAKATPGPWRVAEQRHTQPEPDPLSGKDRRNSIWAGHDRQPMPVVALSSVRPKNTDESWPWMIALSKDDAALIVEAVNALPALLAHLESTASIRQGMEAALERIAAASDDYIGPDEWQARLTWIEAELEAESTRLPFGSNDEPPCRNGWEVSELIAERAGLIARTALASREQSKGGGE